MTRKKIVFLGETYRADAITWINGLKEFGDFEIITWELKTSSNGFFNRIGRIIEFVFSIIKLRSLILSEKPDMVIAERTTSYGFLASISGVKIIAIAQQGITDLWPTESILFPVKKLIQKYAFKKATLIHAWGPVMEEDMIANNVDMSKVLVVPKGIDLRKFESVGTSSYLKINAIVTRSLQAEYRHEVILKAFAIINEQGFDFELHIIGAGTELTTLKNLAQDLKIENKIVFHGRVQNTDLPIFLQNADLYISMPTTEGVSASLFEAMATCCYPIVTDLPGNRSWIKHRINGQLIDIDDAEMLAEEIIWAFKNREYVNFVKQKNRLFVEEHANYEINMKLIADKYHQLLILK